MCTNGNSNRGTLRAKPLKTETRAQAGPFSYAAVSKTVALTLRMIGFVPQKSVEERFPSGLVTATAWLDRDKDGIDLG